MADKTDIAWTDHTFNPWLGCVNVSPACDHCYAEALVKRAGQALGNTRWGAREPRKTMADSNWKKPASWNRKAKKAGQEARVFCASLADVFDNHAPASERTRLWAVIRETPWLEWLLLTKRPQNIAKMLPADWEAGYPNVRLGVSAENQVEADRRIPIVAKIIAQRQPFVSAEPLLEAVDFRRYLADIGWIIVGGESGAAAGKVVRRMQPDWARSIRDQCTAAGVAFFFKQWGSYGPEGRFQSQPAQHGHELDGQVWQQWPTQKAPPPTADKS